MLPDDRKAARRSEDTGPSPAFKPSPVRSASAQKPAGSYPREDTPGGPFRTRPPHAAGDPQPGVKDLPPRSRRQVDHGTRRARARRLETGAATSSGAARRVPAFLRFCPRASARRRAKGAHTCQPFKRRRTRRLLALDGRGGSARSALTEWVEPPSSQEMTAPPPTQSSRSARRQLAHQGRAG